MGVLARGAAKISSTSGALTVTFTAASGATPVVYSDEACTTTITLPATVADGATATFYFASPGQYTVSVKDSSGVELAGDLNQTRVISVFAGDIAAFSYDTRRVAKDASGDPGRRSVKTEAAATSAQAEAQAFTGGTPTFLTFTVPNDGRKHLIVVAGHAHIGAGGQSGGGISAVLTSNGVTNTTTVLPANQGTGDTFGANVFSSAQVHADPGTTVTVRQTAAQTVGSGNTADVYLWLF